MKHCVDCRYLVNGICQSPHLQEKNKVTGEVEKMYLEASTCRSDGKWARLRMTCGPNAIWFKATGPTLIERVIRLFTKE